MLNTSSNQTISITVQSVNDVPKANDDYYNFDYNGTPVRLDVLSNDTSLPDANETLVVSVAVQATDGNASADANMSSILFSPNGNFLGIDSFTYTITDPDGATDTARVDLLIQSTPSLPGWRYLPKFGLYFNGTKPWLQHEDLGWIHVPEEGGQRVRRTIGGWGVPGMRGSSRRRRRPPPPRRRGINADG